MSNIILPSLTLISDIQILHSFTISLWHESWTELLFSLTLHPLGFYELLVKFMAKLKCQLCKCDVILLPVPVFKEWNKIAIQKLLYKVLETAFLLDNLCFYFPSCRKNFWFLSPLACHLWVYLRSTFFSNGGKITIVI